nr:immunoglobulin heavy chain junction region [Mus musculus]
CAFAYYGSSYGYFDVW